MPSEVHLHKSKHSHLEGLAYHASHSKFLMLSSDVRYALTYIDVESKSKTKFSNW